MKFKRVINKQINEKKDGVNVAGGINAVVSGNVGESGSKTSVSSRQRIVQRDGKTEVIQQEVAEGGESDD
jgi:hypothetical protein